jgi:queuine tRNA-ribosyltransferase catalytic subunit
MQPVGLTLGAFDRVDTCTSLLPAHKPRYVMGIGYPEDIVVAVALGADMFDCVWPTRTARFGNAITAYGVLNLKHARYANDFEPMEAGCKCTACRPRAEGGLGISRAYIYHLAAKETVGAHLVTMHNVHHMLNLMKRIRNAILEDDYRQFATDFFSKYFPKEKGPPEWAVEALLGVGIDILGQKAS